MVQSNAIGITPARSGYRTCPIRANQRINIRKGRQRGNIEKSFRYRADPRRIDGIWDASVSQSLPLARRGIRGERIVEFKLAAFLVDQPAEIVVQALENPR